MNDLKSGFLVFLLALPLSLGIATASGAPPLAGLITVLIAGLITSFLGGMSLSIKGPAAGLVVVVYNAIYELGAGEPTLGFQRLMSALFVVGCLQLIASYWKLGNFSFLIPPAVLKGMLTAIGLIVFTKQIYVFLGVQPPKANLFHLLIQIPYAIWHANWIVTTVGASALITLVIWPQIAWQRFQQIPAALIAVAISTCIASYWSFANTIQADFLGTTFPLGSQFLVNLPQQYVFQLHLPDLLIMHHFIFWKHCCIIFFIASIESVLTVSALQHHEKNQSSDLVNRDLRAQGIGNMCCGLLGGLPMISEILRSQANLDHGAQSAWSHFYHGFFMLCTLLFLSPMIAFVPLTTLAAMLLVAAFKLASWQHMIKIYQTGRIPFASFCITILFTFLTDLLIGILAGCFFLWGFSLYRKDWPPYKYTNI